MTQKPSETSCLPETPEAAPRREEQVRSIMRSLRIVTRAVQEHSRWVESQCGLTSPQLWALWELFATPGIKVSELAAVLFIHQSTASNMLDKLEIKGLVERSRGGQDQRIVRLHLSDAGAALLATAPRPAQGAVTVALQQLPDARLESLYAGLDDLVAALRLKDVKANLKPLPDE